MIGLFFIFVNVGSLCFLFRSLSSRRFVPYFAIFCRFFCRFSFHVFLFSRSVRRSSSASSSRNTLCTWKGNLFAPTTSLWPTSSPRSANKNASLLSPSDAEISPPPSLHLRLTINTLSFPTLTVSYVTSPLVYRALPHPYSTLPSCCLSLALPAPCLTPVLSYPTPCVTRSFPYLTLPSSSVTPPSPDPAPPITILNTQPTVPLIYVH